MGECYGNSMEATWEYMGIPWEYCEYNGNAMRILWQYSGNTMGILWEYKGIAVGILWALWEYDGDMDLGISGHILAYLTTSGHVWPYLAISGHNRTYLGISDYIWPFQY